MDKRTTHKQIQSSALWNQIWLLCVWHLNCTCLLGSERLRNLRISSFSSQNLHNTSLRLEQAIFALHLQLSLVNVPWYWTSPVSWVPHCNRSCTFACSLSWFQFRDYSTATSRQVAFSPHYPPNLQLSCTENQSHMGNNSILLNQATCLRYCSGPLDP